MEGRELSQLLQKDLRPHQSPPPTSPPPPRKPPPSSVFGFCRVPSPPPTSRPPPRKPPTQPPIQVHMEPEPSIQFEVSSSENMGDTGLLPIPIPNESTSIRSPTALPPVPAPQRNTRKLASRGRGN
ncbi:uncharacterized protein DS421_12g352660 [Arachis hypogaea]|nr:uncharacterized protein DS421_12g352660 [Arachis hypogaea]